MKIKIIDVDGTKEFNAFVEQMNKDIEEGLCIYIDAEEEGYEFNLVGMFEGMYVVIEDCEKLTVLK